MAESERFPTLSIETRCLMCGQAEPQDSERARLTRARHAVMDAWQSGAYADDLGRALRDTWWLDVVDDAIAAVRAADAESERLRMVQ